MKLMPSDRAVQRGLDVKKLRDLKDLTIHDQQRGPFLQRRQVYD